MESESSAREGGDLWKTKVAVVIPCYRVRDHILGVLEGVGPEVCRVYVVDDCCPEGSGVLVEESIEDPRVQVLFHEVNQGVGGATMTGYRKALLDNADIVVKLDGDGQMDPGLIPALIRPVQEGYADYTKGNRFFDPGGLSSMPMVRLFGNAVLSFMTKLSSGYWRIFDPTNGFTAIHSLVLQKMPLSKIDKRYFFESDMLFRLNTLRAVIVDVPMAACYGSEESGLKIKKIIPIFLKNHVRNTFKRIFYNYYLRDFSVASIELIMGFVFQVFGIGFGLLEWSNSVKTGIPVTSGTVMLSALPVLVGVQLVLSFLSFDVGGDPQNPLHKRL